ncbi:hypothetical protein C366_01266 [Cryptococcus neoformans Tu401-1]|nr:hypothetical protein C366_01266 [Cryptococcus neoformans var. grubii Tu401-1]OXM80902.1 hypothetical protein C364_01272 [Cryptococcus neoformans var. grubii Bt63]
MVSRVCPSLKNSPLSTFLFRSLQCTTFLRTSSNFKLTFSKRLSRTWLARTLSKLPPVSRQMLAKQLLLPVRQSLHPLPLDHRASSRIDRHAQLTHGLFGYSILHRFCWMDYFNQGFTSILCGFQALSENAWPMGCRGNALEGLKRDWIKWGVDF